MYGQQSGVNDTGSGEETAWNKVSVIIMLIMK